MGAVVNIFRENIAVLKLFINNVLLGFIIVENDRH